jgi:hypothetical protein
MNVVIAGSSIAGLACAATLRKLPFVKTIKVLDTKCSRATNDAARASHVVDQLYTGIWNPGAYGIRNHIEVPEAVIRKLFQPVGNSGYKSVSGRWLANPSLNLMGAFDSHPSLSFVRNRDLLRTLEEAAGIDDNLTDKYAKVEIVRDARVVDLQLHRDRSTAGYRPLVQISVSSCGGRGKNEESVVLDADLLVAADGCFSTVRRLALSDTSHSSDVRAGEIDKQWERERGRVDAQLMSLYKRRGYTVYRGHSAGTVSTAENDATTVITRISDVAFQTWGPGARFACVPTLTGNAWFAALTTSPTGASSIPGVENGRQCHAALANGSRLVSAKELTQLKEKFRGWHEPIGMLLSNTDVVTDNHTRDE